MIRRVYALSPTTEAFNQECPTLSFIFNRLGYPVARINSTITKTIQRFSFGTREKNEVDSSVVRVSLPLKDQTSANAVKMQMISVTRLAFTTTRIWQQKTGTRPQAQRNQASNRKSTMRCLFFYMWSVWFRLCRLFGSTPSSTYCWTKLMRSVNTIWQPMEIQVSSKKTNSAF